VAIAIAIIAPLAVVIYFVLHSDWRRFLVMLAAGGVAEILLVWSLFADIWVGPCLATVWLILALGCKSGCLRSGNGASAASTYAACSPRQSHWLPACGGCLGTVDR
jgi:hypothetical protein